MEGSLQGGFEDGSDDSSNKTAATWTRPAVIRAQRHLLSHGCTGLSLKLMAYRQDTHPVRT